MYILIYYKSTCLSDLLKKSVMLIPFYVKAIRGIWNQQKRKSEIWVDFPCRLIWASKGRARWDAMYWGLSLKRRKGVGRRRRELAREALFVSRTRYYWSLTRRWDSLSLYIFWEERVSLTRVKAAIRGLVRVSSGFWKSWCPIRRYEQLKEKTERRKSSRFLATCRFFLKPEISSVIVPPFLGFCNFHFSDYSNVFCSDRILFIVEDFVFEITLDCDYLN